VIYDNLKKHVSSSYLCLTVYLQILPNFRHDTGYQLIPGGNIRRSVIGNLIKDVEARKPFLLVGIHKCEGYIVAAHCMAEYNSI
jgi:hypothetical protein